MTGVYIRVERDGKWQNLEIEHLTDKERNMILLDGGDERLMQWLHLVCNKLSEMEGTFEDLVSDGILKVG